MTWSVLHFALTTGCLGFFCSPILACKLSKKMDECCCAGCIGPAALRTKHRMKHDIKVSDFNSGKPPSCLKKCLKLPYFCSILKSCLKVTSRLQYCDWATKCFVCRDPCARTAWSAFYHVFRHALCANSLGIWRQDHSLEDFKASWRHFVFSCNISQWKDGILSFKFLFITKSV